MNTEISSDNPFGHNRAGFAWEKVPRDSRCHLDFGCYQGRFLDSLRAKGVARLVGIDASGQAIQAGRERFRDLELLHRTQTVPLPFDDATFDSISILDVLEHVWEQKALLDEFYRVLKAGGILIVTVPQRHVFSFLDLGNLKFRFPRLHRWFYCLGHSEQQYRRRYVSNPEDLVGDISAEKRWHEHFTRTHLTDLLFDCGFTVTELDGAGLFGRAISPLLHLFGWIGLVKRMVWLLMGMDARWFQSADLFCVASKRPRMPAVG